MIPEATSHQKELAVESYGDPEELRAYTRRKLAIANQLRALLDVLKKRGSESHFRRCEELMVKLAEDRFTLAVVGQFKRGKSSLMNAIIGRELLPTGVLPLTSAITILRFGAPERVIVHREDSQFPESVPVSALPSYVTERGNPANRRRVKAAIVEVPLPFLRRGLEFVDTPGVGSAIEANSATTYRFLPECDAVIFVTSVDSPFTEAELDFLDAIGEHVRKIFFVVNKTDLLPDQRERDEVFKFVESELRAKMKTAQIRIFPVSSLLALTKIRSADGEGAASSGLEEFQAALARFLAREKADVFLTAIIDKAVHLLDEESHVIELYRRAREMPEATVRERLNSVKSKWRQLASDRQKVFEQLRDAIGEAARESSASRLDEKLRADQKELSRRLPEFIAAGGWRLGEEVANRWTAFVFKRLAKTVASWIAEVEAELNLGSQPVAIEAARELQANLRQITKIAANAFDLEFENGELALPRLSGETFAYPPLELKEPGNNLGVALRLLLVRWSARRLKPAVEAMTNQLVKIHRAHALALITEGARSAVEGWASRVDALASEIELHATSTITGEQAGSQSWRQTSAPLADPGWGGAELAAIRARLAGIRDGEGDGLSSVEKGAGSELLRTTEGRPRKYSGSAWQELRPRKKIDIASDLRARGCAVCDHVIKIAHVFFAQWQYALASEEKAQRRFAADLGFCPLHTWQLHALSSPLGESIGLAPLAEEVSRLLQNMGSESAVEAVRKLLHTSGSCRVCRLLAEVESDYLERLNAFLADENNRKLYERSQGVCLRHLAGVIGIAREEVKRFLVAKAARDFSELAEDMQSYAIKRDAIRRHLTNLNEGDAYVRALVRLAGAKDFSTPWPDDGEI
jgi:predicted GTPase